MTSDVHGLDGSRGGRSKSKHTTYSRRIQEPGYSCLSFSPSSAEAAWARARARRRYLSACQGHRESETSHDHVTHGHVTVHRGLGVDRGGLLTPLRHPLPPSNVAPSEACCLAYSHRSGHRPRRPRAVWIASSLSVSTSIPFDLISWLPITESPLLCKSNLWSGSEAGVQVQ